MECTSYPQFFRPISPLLVVISIFSYVGQLDGPLIKEPRAGRSFIEVCLINTALVSKWINSLGQRFLCFTAFVIGPALERVCQLVCWAIYSSMSSFDLLLCCLSSTGSDLA